MKPFKAQLDAQLVARTRSLVDLRLELSATLPPECDGHYHVADVRDKTVVIVTDSPVWTTRLRQLGPQILQCLAGKTRQPLQHVRVISRRGPVVSDYQPPVVKRELSASASEHIARSASYIDDQRLSEALMKLSRHTRPVDDKS